MAWYHFIPGIGLGILAVEKAAETVTPDAPQQLTVADERAIVSAEIESYTSGLPITQRPTDFFKNTSGEWILKFANGRTISLNAYKALSNTERALIAGSTSTTNTGLGLTGTGTGSGTGTGTGSGTGDEKSLFTTTNILLGVGILAALGIVLYLIFRKNGNRKR